MAALVQTEQVVIHTPTDPIVFKDPKTFGKFVNQNKDDISFYQKELNKLNSILYIDDTGEAVYHNGELYSLSSDYKYINVNKYDFNELWDKLVKASYYIRHLYYQSKEVSKDFEPYQIEIRTMTGKTLTIEINYNMKICKLKELIQDNYGTPVDQQRLIYSGQYLKDNRTIDSYKIKSKTIHLLCALRGGMHHGTSFPSDYHKSIKIHDYNGNILTKIKDPAGMSLQDIKSVCQDLF